MLVACRLAGLSALETYYAGVRERAQCGRRRVTVDLPGTALYWTEYHPTARPVHHGHRLAFAVVVAALVAAIWWLAIA